MTRRRSRTALVFTLGLAALLALSACVPNRPVPVSSARGTGSLTVTATATDCALSASTASSGTVRFTVDNTTDDVTEFYLLASDGTRIVGEVENVAPGAPRELTVSLTSGDYITLCKPGAVGSGVGRAKFTVTDSGKEVTPSGSVTAQTTAAAANYVAWVRGQVAQLVPATQAFVTAYLAGDATTARAVYPSARAYYERIEPVAESFGELDPEIDFHEADVADGAEWTGWHRVEKDLWPPTAGANGGAGYVALTGAERSSIAGKLTANTQQLAAAVNATEYTVGIDAISNGAIALLDEVANGKITGEEEIWSHTDLWDFQANLEGAEVAYEGVRDIVAANNPALVKSIDAQFTALTAQLAAYGSLKTGFVYYNDLTTAQVKQLADGVNALSEPLSKLTAALVG
jgi:iron uptake system component EfeO